TIIKWTKQPGERIELDDTILEIATDKVDSEVPAPVVGTLVKQLYKEDDIVQVGAVIAIIETEGAESTSEASMPAEVPNDLPEVPLPAALTTEAASQPAQT